MDLGPTYTHQDMFGPCDEFFDSRKELMEKNLKFARRPLVNKIDNTYRLYFFRHSELPSQLTNTQIFQADYDIHKRVFRLGSIFITCLSSKPTSKFTLSNKVSLHSLNLRSTIAALPYTHSFNTPRPACLLSPSESLACSSKNMSQTRSAP